MLKVILTILKFCGITVGIVLAVIIVLLLLLLFVPVRYDVFLENEEEMKAKGKVHWLFHIISFQIVYENREMKKVLRIFGVPVWKE
ncbi:MAG: hypothetical protein ACI4DV_00775 [Lachnospiraceae bacterium]